MSGFDNNLKLGGNVIFPHSEIEFLKMNETYFCIQENQKFKIYFSKK